MNGEPEKCRWCGALSVSLNCGRCGDCDAHYRTHAIRIVSHLPKRNFHYGNYIAFGVVLLISLSFASCYYDAGFQRTICFGNETVVPPYSYLRTGMTPFKAQQQYEKFMGNQAAEVELFLHPQQLPRQTQPALVPTNSTTVVRQNRTVVACQNDLERDWQSYCQSNLAGFDCFNANKDTKEMIMRNMAEIRSCFYTK